MITEVQRKKLAHFFELLDSHKNGFLHVDDFSEIAERIRMGIGYEAGGEKHKFLAEKSTRFFHAFLNAIPHNGNQVITKEEWVNFVEEEIISKGNEEVLEEFKEFIIGFLFDLFDENHDGYISTDEFVDMFVVYGIDIKYSAKSFLKLDLNKDDKLSRNELLHAFEVFLLSDDPSQPGNWIFGNWE
ncbi:EF-hand domain-containing protein [Marinoscillum furvescens]|uniref:Ca2+-binding EF-hand superfamily protein n=1 Tax=Marinoscillum furvescens DSM 4134 TaxID=1122208 RepID=A0A3D9L6X8_MARFU|nr:EF-hand domain-containing protein [Marinoscillum furvescens]REE02109.1 Ca2+-binding EF-hand superfamily protein [Marinoscillum furvescens DSM 4134]